MSDTDATTDPATVVPDESESHECLAFYGLRSAPFRATVDPKLLWLGKRQQDVLTTLAAAIRQGAGIFVVTSDIGAGKTTLTHSLVAKLKEDDVLIGHVTNPGADISDFFQAVGHAYRLRATFETKDAFVVELQQHLAGDGAPGKKVLLVVDEAQSLSGDVLHEIRDLSIISEAQGQSLAILLVGQNDLAIALAEEEQAALRQRITLKCTLDPLTPHEVGEYIAHCLATVGATREIFNTDAIREIALVSRGTPAVINAICDRALLTGYVRLASTIGRDIVEECCATLPATQRATSAERRNGAVSRPGGHRAPEARIRKRSVRHDAPPSTLELGRSGRLAVYAGVTAALISIGVGYGLHAGWFAGARHQQTIAAPASTPAPAATQPDATPPASPAATRASVASPNASDAASLPAPTAAALVLPPSPPPSPSAEGERPTANGAVKGSTSDIERLAPVQSPRDIGRPKPSLAAQDDERPKSIPTSRVADTKPKLSSAAMQPSRSSDVGAPAASPRPEPKEPPRVTRDVPRKDRSTDTDADAADPGGIIDWLLTQGAAGRR